VIDAITGLAVMASIGVVIFIANYGELRLYVPVAISAGFLACQFFLGDLLYLGSYKVFRFGRVAVRWLILHILDPIARALLKPLNRFLGGLFTAPPPPPPGDN